MAQYQHLTLYKSSYDFLAYFAQILHHYQREYRYTIGEKLINTIIEFIVLIYRANSAKLPIERFKTLQELDEKLQTVEIYLRLSNTLKSLSQERYTFCCEKIIDISKQLSGWMSYTASQLEKKENEKELQKIN